MEFEDVFCANRGFCSGASLVVVSVRTGLSWHGCRLRRLWLSFSTYQPKMMMPNSVNNIFCNVRTLLLQSSHPNGTLMDEQKKLLSKSYLRYKSWEEQPGIYFVLCLWSILWRSFCSCKASGCHSQNACQISWQHQTQTLSNGGGDVMVFVTFLHQH